MHVVISWDISNKLRWEELNDRLKSCIASHSWVKPLSTLYVVRVASLQDRDLIMQRLIDVAKQNPNDINILCTPVMSGGSYHGWLPQNMWSEILLRTN